MVRQQQSVEQLFGAALDLSEDERHAMLDRACPNDPDLREAVEELFRAHEAAGDFLEQPLFPHLGRDLAGPSAATAGASAVPSQSRFEAGQIIAGRFTVIRFIACGGMGEVYEVDDRLLPGARLALKAILPQIAAEASSSRRFEQEVLLARRVIHPNLCPIYDISRSHDTTPPCLFLTMKLLAGETLAARLKVSRPADPEEILSIVRQLTGGIAAIHAAGVIHGDIKPNNIMLDHAAPAVCLSIMDFGLARLHESENTVRTRTEVAGTPGYIAPELYRGERPSQATDLYAFGVLLHVLLTGETPKLRHGSLSVEPSPKLALTPSARLFAPAIRQFISDYPDHRYTAFKHLRAYFEGRAAPTAVTKPDLGDAVEPLPVRHRLLSRRTFAITSATAACAAAAGLAWQGDSLSHLLHPLPRKRFVALMSWPAPDPRLKPMLLNLIDSIGNELARAEAFDHDLYIIPHATAADITTPKQLNDTRDALGANLILATSVTPANNDLHVNFQVLDPNSPHPLRTKQISAPTDQQASLFDRSVHTVASLLDIHHFTPDDKRLSVGTEVAQALTAYQAAEALVKQPNDSGLEAALEKYKEAVELDPKFATAYAKLALAYFRLYVLRRDSAALMLTRANCETALSLSPSLVDAHLALAEVMYQSGERVKALNETSKALTLDPMNPRALATHGLTLTMCNRWVEAEDTVHRLLRARPNSWRGRITLGYLYSLIGRYPEALMEFKTASLALPKDALSLGDIAVICLQQGKLAEAKQYAKRSLAVAPNPSAATTLAEVLRIETSYDEAVRFAKQATALDPSDPVAWLQLADCCDCISTQKEIAASSFRKVSELQQQLLAIDVADGPGWMILALAKAKGGEKHQALDLVRRADATFADDLESQLCKVRTLELAGQRDEAIDTLSRCLHRGATLFQIGSMPDLKALRTDNRYKLFSSRPLPA